MSMYGSQPLVKPMRFQRKIFSCYTALHFYWISETQSHNNHTVSWMSVHIAWVTECRYHVLQGDMQARCRDLVKRICDWEDVKILKGLRAKTMFTFTLSIHLRNRSAIWWRGWGGEPSEGSRKNFRDWARDIGSVTLENWLWSMEHGKHDGSDGSAVPGASSRSVGFGYG